MSNARIDVSRTETPAIGAAFTSATHGGGNGGIGELLKVGPEEIATTGVTRWTSRARVSSTERVRVGGTTLAHTRLRVSLPSRAARGAGEVVAIAGLCVGASQEFGADLGRLVVVVLAASVVGEARAIVGDDIGLLTRLARIAASGAEEGVLVATARRTDGASAVGCGGVGRTGSARAASHTRSEETSGARGTRRVGKGSSGHFNQTEENGIVTIAQREVLCVLPSEDMSTSSNGEGNLNVGELLGDAIDLGLLVDLEGEEVETPLSVHSVLERDASVSHELRQKHTRTR